jgi:hypothetical protein
MGVSAHEISAPAEDFQLNATERALTGLEQHVAVATGMQESIVVIKNDHNRVRPITPPGWHHPDEFISVSRCDRFELLLRSRKRGHN